MPLLTIAMAERAAARRGPRVRDHQRLDAGRGGARARGARRARGASHARAAGRRRLARRRAARRLPPRVRARRAAAVVVGLLRRRCSCCARRRRRPKRARGRARRPSRSRPEPDRGAAYTRPHERDRVSSPRPGSRRARPRASSRRSAAPFRIGAVQQRWHPDPVEHEAALAEGIRARGRRGRAARVPAGADAVAVLRGRRPTAPEARRRAPEAIPGRADERVRAADGGRDGRVRARVAVRAGRRRRRRLRLQHRDLRRARRRRSSRARASCTSPSPPATTRTATSGPGPPTATRSRSSALGEARLGFPTCWDQWFPELARAYSLAGAEVHRLPDRDRLRARPPGASTPSRCGSR